MKVICGHCNRPYEVGYPRMKRKRRMNLLLAFARCPHCNWWRTSLGKMKADEPHCVICALPLSVVRGIARDGICVSCASRKDYYLGRKSENVGSSV